MTINRRLISAAILVAIGIVIATQVVDLRSQPLHGYAVFGAAGNDQPSGISLVSWSSTAADSNDQDLSVLGTRANLIVSGRDVYFDANKNGKPESSERFQSHSNAFKISSADGRSQYRMTKASVGVSPDHVSEKRPQYVMLTVDVLDLEQPESVRFRQTGKVNVFPAPVDQGWVHFDGPLTIKFWDKDLTLPASNGPVVDLRLAVFTPSVEYGTEAAEKKARSNPTAIVPGFVVPTVTINFPSGTDDPITQRYDLDQFC